MNVDAIIDSLVSQQTYKDLKILKSQITNGDNLSIENAVQAIHNVLQGYNYTPLQKLLSLRLCKDGMDTFNQIFVKQIAIKVLPFIRSIAMFDQLNPNEDRGKLFFSQIPGIFQKINKQDKNQATCGHSLVRLSLECITVWSTWFPVDFDSSKPSQYKIVFEELVQNHVTLPKVLQYYKPEDIYKLVQSTLIEKTTDQILRRAEVDDSQKQKYKIFSQPINSVPTVNHQISINEQSAVNLVKHAIQLKESIRFKCQHNGADVQVPHFQLDPLIQQLQKMVDDYKLLLSEVDFSNEELLSKIFEERQWAERTIQEYQKIGDQGYTWSWFRSKFLSESNNNSQTVSVNLPGPNVYQTILEAELHQQIQQYQKSLITYEKENKILTEQKNTLQTQLTQLNQELLKFSAHHPSLQQTIQNQDDVIQNLIKEQQLAKNDKLTIQQLQENTMQAQNKIEEQRQIIKQLEQNILETNQKSHKIFQVQQDTMQTENQKLKAELVKLRNDIEQLQLDNQRLQKGTNQLDEELQHNKKLIQKLEKDVLLVQDENSDFQKQLLRVSRNPSIEKKADISNKLSKDLLTMIKDKLDLNEQLENTTIQLQDLEDSYKTLQVELIGRDQSILILNERIKSIKKDHEIQVKSIQFNAQQGEKSESYQQLLKDYHKQVQNSEKLENLVKSQYNDSQSEYEVKNSQVNAEKEALIEQVYKLYEENSELVKENQYLKDLDHQNQMNNISQNRSSLVSSTKVVSSNKSEGTRYLSQKH